MPVYKNFTPEENEFWETYKDYSYTYMRLDLAKLLDVPSKRVSVPLLRELFYTAGVQPHEFLIRTNARYPASYSHMDWQFEIRFAGPEVVSLLKLAGLVA